MVSQVDQSDSGESAGSESESGGITGQYTAISKETLVPAFIAGCSLSAVIDTLKPALHLAGAIIPFIALPIMLINMNDAVSSTVEEYHLDGLTSVEKKEIEQSIKSNKKRSVFSTIQYLIPSTLTCVGYFVGLGLLATALPAWSAIAATIVLAIPCYNAHKKMKIYDGQIERAVAQLGDDHALSCYNAWAEASSKTDNRCLWSNRSTANKREEFIGSLRSAPSSDENNRILKWVGQREEQRHTRNLLGQLASVAATIAIITVVASILTLAVSPPGITIALGAACGIGAVIGMRALYRHYKNRLSENIQEDSASLLNRETDTLGEGDVREASVSMQLDHDRCSSDAFSMVGERASEAGDFDDAEFFYTEEEKMSAAHIEENIEEKSELLHKQSREHSSTGKELERERALFEEHEEHPKASESTPFQSNQEEQASSVRPNECSDTDEDGLVD